MTANEHAIEECLRAARTSALVVDETPSFGALVVRGADRMSWLNGLVTCDMTKLGPDRALYGLAVTPKGRVLADLVFVAEAEHVLLLLPMSEVASVAAAFEHYLVMEDAELMPAPDAYRVCFVHGPEAGRVLERARAAGATAATLDRLGLGGGVVVTHVSSADAVRAALAAAVTEAGGAMGGVDVAEILRIEQGVPRFGVDFGPSTYPQEAGLEQRAVSFDKGCYLGQEVVCMLQLRGHVKRKLVPVLFENGVAVPGTSVVSADGQPLGELTTIGASPSLGKNVGLAMVKIAFAAPGTELRIGDAKAFVRDETAAASS